MTTADLTRYLRRMKRAMDERCSCFQCIRSWICLSSPSGRKSSAFWTDIRSSRRRRWSYAIDFYKQTIRVLRHWSIRSMIVSSRWTIIATISIDMTRTQQKMKKTTKTKTKKNERKKRENMCVCLTERCVELSLRLLTRAMIALRTCLPSFLPGRFPLVSFSFFFFFSLRFSRHLLTDQS